MARSALRVRSTWGIPCAASLCVSALLTTACTDAARSPLAPQATASARGPRRMVADCDPATGEDCGDDGPVGGPMSSTQLEWTDDSYYYVNAWDQGGKCGDLWQYAVGATILYNNNSTVAARYYPSSGDFDTQTFPDDNPTFVMGPKVNANARQWTKGMIHEAAHAMWGLVDQGAGQLATTSNPEWWAQVCVP